MPTVPSNGASVLYNSYAKFHNGDSEFKYTLVDGSSYLTTTDAFDAETVRCIPPNTLTFDEILPALNNTTPIASASIGDKSVECESGTLLETAFARSHCAICASGEAVFTAFGSDLDIAVEYLDDPVSVSKPGLTDKSMSCDIVQEATSLTPTALDSATGAKIPSSTLRMLKEEAHMAMKATTCESCLSAPRSCIFFHDLGNPIEKLHSQDTPKLINARLGDIYGHARCCSEIKYAVLKTIDSIWTNDSLQQKFCDNSLSMSNSSDVAAEVIDNTIIVTHSMGGLVMAHALSQDKCSFSKTTSWMSQSPPMTGCIRLERRKPEAKRRSLVA
ncbi:hypothetical protein PI124_g8723 [Phytophthora idaei]|nr:hypothetical protein PI125_g21643 [Phytophthora idaei]KAG3132502.1 hypothetical protein PI126_g19610 [Phytophthora idaei]KAG3246565.1 hypothetical protein PI124_g8723 [Phytophthora idaei]